VRVGYPHAKTPSRKNGTKGALPSSRQFWIA